MGGAIGGLHLKNLDLSKTNEWLASMLILISSSTFMLQIIHYTSAKVILLNSMNIALFNDFPFSQ
jgi:hypothetical protein